jgi:hypothetical protein
MRENTERWMELARLAATEQDPQKLAEPVREIKRSKSGLRICR